MIEELAFEASEGQKNIYYSVNLKFDFSQPNLTLLRTSDRLEAETLKTNIAKFLDEL